MPARHPGRMSTGSVLWVRGRCERETRSVSAITCSASASDDDADPGEPGASATGAFELRSLTLPARLSARLRQKRVAMSQVCRNCSRPNPPDAMYCYYDGFSLGSTISVTRPLASGTQPFTSPFVFPSGQKCRNFDELVRAAFDLWEEAQELLKDGTFAGFLGGLGRADLARLARQAMTSANPNRALDEFLAGMPSTVRQPAALHVEPQEINLGDVKSPETRSLTLRIENKGRSLLYGTVASEETPWLVIGEMPGVPQKLFECRREMAIPVQVIGERMRASSKGLEGKLVIESNGGNATVM